MNERLIIVSPHPDDETLGAGGTILRYKSQGAKVFWLNITNIKIEYGYLVEHVKNRKEEIEKINKLYGFDGFYNLELEPSTLDSSPKKELIGKISKIMNKVKPSTIILPYKGDIHSDHGIVFDCVYSCSKIFRYPFVKKILSMEILSETDFSVSDKGFTPNYYVNITDFLDKKIQIMKIYKTEFKAHPFPRSEESIISLAILRGEQAGVKYAEGFRLIKYIE